MTATLIAAPPAALAWSAAYHLTGSAHGGAAALDRAATLAAAMERDPQDPRTLLRALLVVLPARGHEPENGEGLATALHALPLDLRAAVVLHDVLGLPAAEVAAILGVRRSQLRTRLAKGRSALMGMAA